MAVSPQGHEALRVAVFQDYNVALAVSVRLTVAYPVFAAQPYGAWAGVLTAQALRGHTRFFLNQRNAVRGFFGFALAGRADAEAWAFHKLNLSDERCRGGDCLIVNAWVALDAAANAAMINEIRGLGVVAVYYKRFYACGRIRAVRLSVIDPRFSRRNVPRRAGGA